ncbi:MAG: antitoxin [Armatimonadetes bacterium]|nr:antitoxin [Armatimonadota bacterium]
MLDEEERERFRQQAAREGMSLSAWMRAAAQEKVAAQAGQRIRTVDDLREFFGCCDRREQGIETDWDEHLQVIDASRASGAAPT